MTWVRTSNGINYLPNREGVHCSPYMLRLLFPNEVALCVGLSDWGIRRSFTTLEWCSRRSGAFHEWRHWRVKVGPYVRAQIGEKGRLVIPAAMREELGIRPGDTVELRVEDHEVRISTRRARIKRAQERVRQFVPEGVLLSEELSAERRDAAKHECEAVLDASVILALLQNERGAERLTDALLEDSVASTVNLAEVQSKLVIRGLRYRRSLGPCGIGCCIHRSVY